MYDLPGVEATGTVPVQDRILELALLEAEPDGEGDTNDGNQETSATYLGVTGWHLRFNFGVEGSGDHQRPPPGRADT